MLPHSKTTTDLSSSTIKGDLKETHNWFILAAIKKHAVRTSHKGGARPDAKSYWALDDFSTSKILKYKQISIFIYFYI